MSTGYIEEFEEIDDHRSGKIVVQLNGRINKTCAVSPRFNIQLKDFDKWETKLLPSRSFGFIVMTTSSGIMDHQEARRKHEAGKVCNLFWHCRDNIPILTRLLLMIIRRSSDSSTKSIPSCYTLCNPLCRKRLYFVVAME